MTRKRKSMNAGNDAHAYKLRIYAVYHRSAAADLSAIKGFQGCCPDKYSACGRPHALLAKIILSLYEFQLLPCPYGNDISHRLSL